MGKCRCGGLQWVWTGKRKRAGCHLVCVAYKSLFLCYSQWVYVDHEIETPAQALVEVPANTPNNITLKGKGSQFKKKKTP